MDKVRMSVCVAALVIALVVPITVRAGAEFVLVHGDKTLTGGEVCFYKADIHADAFAPQKYFFHSSEVRCLPASTVLDMPPGRFFFFARHPDGYVSAHRSMRFAAEPSGECYERLDMTVVPSAILDLSTAKPSVPDAYFGAWIDDTERSLSSFIPAVPGESSIRVPAGILVVPMEIVDHVPRRLGSPTVLKPGARVPVELRTEPGRGDLVAWLEGNDAVVRTLSKERSLGRADVELVTASGAKLTPVALPRHQGSYSGALLVFKNIPAGSVKISVGSEQWTRDEVNIEVREGGVAVAPRGLRTLPAATIRVELPAAFAAPVSFGTCEELQLGAEVRLLRCAVPGSTSCASVASAPVTAPASETSFRGLAEGDYSVELRLPDGRTGTSTVTAQTGREVTAAPQLEGLVVYGTVRKGRNPIRGEIQFPTGETYLSGSAGEYRALLRENPGRNPIRIKTCTAEKTFFFVPEGVPSAYEAFDITIPDNTLRITVRDASTGKPISGARIRYGVLTADANAESSSFPALFTHSGTADTDGVTLFDGIPGRRSIRVCASAKGYQPFCANTIESVAAGEQKLTIDLQPETLLRGRLIAPADTDQARIFFLSPAGQLIANVIVAADGSFSYPLLPANAKAVIVGPALSLTVVGSLVAEGEGLVIRLRSAAARRIRVLLKEGAPRRRARIGLIVDGSTIPAEAFSWHQEYRGLQTVALAGTLEIPDIAAAGRIGVILGPDPEDRSLPPDAAGRPEYTSSFPIRWLDAGRDEAHFDGTV